MSKKIDILGKKFGKWVVVKENFDKVKLLKYKGRYWECICECGNAGIILQYNLTRGLSTSCGCEGYKNRNRAVTTHGLSKHPLHNIWRKMIARCYNKNDQRYCYYGARGISICETWESDFSQFYEWSMNNGWEKGLQIDRINNDGNYEPHNCRWTDRKTQCRNRRNNRIITCRGMTKTLAEFAEIVGERSDIIHARMRRGWSEEDAIFTPFKR